MTFAYKGGGGVGRGLTIVLSARDVNFLSVYTPTSARASGVV